MYIEWEIKQTRHYVSMLEAMILSVKEQTIKSKNLKYYHVFLTNSPFPISDF